ncbi:hypothetical protein [uncultured Variovorax sp.]|jgi:hypothetical protein|nr:hypothetical protein [uncultured Variovorax sp.]
MKIFLEADFTKGSGAFRWEGVTTRRLRRLMGSAIVIVGAITLFAFPRF